MKELPASKKIRLKLSSRNVFLLSVQLIFTLFVVLLGLVIRDYTLTTYVNTNREKAKTLILEGEYLNIEPNSTQKFTIKASPLQAKTRVALVRMDFANAKILDFKAGANYIVVGACPDGSAFMDNKLCADLGNIVQDIQDNEDVAEVTLSFGETTSFSVVTALDNGFYNGRALDKNENTAMVYDGFSTLPLTGDETPVNFDLTHYPVFILIGGIIIFGSLASLVYLLIRKDKDTKTRFVRGATVTGIVLLAGGSIFISSYLGSNQVSVEDSQAANQAVVAGGCENISIYDPGVDNIVCDTEGCKPTCAPGYSINGCECVPDPFTECEKICRAKKYFGVGEYCQKAEYISASPDIKNRLYSCGLSLKGDIPEGYYDHDVVMTAYCDKYFLKDTQGNTEITPVVSVVDCPKGCLAKPEGSNDVCKTETITDTPVAGSIACGQTGCTKDADCADSGTAQGTYSCDEKNPSNPATQKCIKNCKYGNVSGDVCACATPTPTPTPSPMPTPVVCKPEEKAIAVTVSCPATTVNYGEKPDLKWTTSGINTDAFKVQAYKGANVYYRDDQLSKDARSISVTIPPNTQDKYYGGINTFSVRPVNTKACNGDWKSCEFCYESVDCAQAVNCGKTKDCGGTCTACPTATPIPTATPKPTATPISTATPTPTITLTPKYTLTPTVTVTSPATPLPDCGPMDTNGDKVLNYVDLYDFTLKYNNKCHNDTTQALSCGGKDVNGDDFLNYVDLDVFAKNYAPRVQNCSILEN